MFVAVLLAEALTAFCALAFEVVAARLLAPHVGMSTDTWTAIIGAFLLSMALGNQIGAALASHDKVPLMLHRAMLAVAAGGAAVFASWYLVFALAPILSSTPTELWRVVVFAALPCIPAGLLFGIATPLLMMAALTVARGQGRTIGAVYAAGAIGSVAGVLAAQWLLLDGVGVRASLEAICAISFANALLIACAAARQPVHQVPA